MARILVVDDDPRNLRLAVTVLRKAARWEATRAWFSACLRDTLDCVLVDDYQLVGFNQCGSLRHARAVKPWNSRIFMLPTRI